MEGHFCWGVVDVWVSSDNRGHKLRKCVRSLGNFGLHKVISAGLCLKLRHLRTAQGNFCWAVSEVEVSSDYARQFRLGCG